jgi:hypothetical protein
MAAAFTRLRYIAGTSLAAISMLLVPAVAHASTFGGSSGTGAASTPTPAGDFNLQITPSPLVTTVQPGVKSQVELKIRNGGSGTEALKIDPRSFTLSNDSSNVQLQDTTPPDISNWISFSAPKFTVQAGQWFSEQITFNVPKDAGFSYSFALEISRQSNPAPQGGL